MGTVIDMAEYRERRGWQALREAILNPPMWPLPVPTNEAQRLEVAGYEPSYTVYDETHLWTETDLAPFLAAIDATVDAIGQQYGIPSGLLRSIPCTDHGSDDGDAASDRGDAEEPHREA